MVLKICVMNKKYFTLVLIIPVLYISESCIEIKINLNFYFHTFLWCLKRFYEGFVVPQKVL